MATKKTPAPRRAGNAKQATAEKNAHLVLQILEGDPDLIRLFIEISSAISKRRRAVRRRA